MWGRVCPLPLGVTKNCVEAWNPLAAVAGCYKMETKHTNELQQDLQQDPEDSLNSLLAKNYNSLTKPSFETSERI
jgi:hypothetical protein